ncbi:hypothetical protein SB749_12255 [Brevibacterium sp. SIMBA_078]|uniref:hypothetical protein n=1 Tax=Brevibacterium sp. SIMBA_078 TaxID=3085816 RepID=UPI00397E916F
MRRRSFWIILAAALVLIIAAITVLLTRPSTRTLTIDSTTDAIAVTIDGHSYGLVDDGDTIDVRTRGTITITATKDGFDDFHETREITDDATLSLELTPNTDEAEQEVKDDAMANAMERQTQKWPVLRDLPVESELFRAYQGIDKNSSDPTAWTLHLYLYKGHEQDGREAFQKWLSEGGYSIDGIPITEHIDPSLAPGVAVDPPTRSELEVMSTDDVDVYAIRVPASGDSNQQAAVEFATATTSWNPAEDKTRNKALERAEPLMTDKLAKASTDDVRQGYSKSWDWATQHQARSYSWPIRIDQDPNDDTTITVGMCWAFISDDAPPMIEGVREYEITLDPEPAPRVSSYTYEDPTSFVATDPSEDCLAPEPTTS